MLEILKKDPIPKDIKSLYFGLATLSFPEIDVVEQTTIYVTGSSLEPQDDSEWHLSSNYEPRRRYMLLDGFAQWDQFKKKGLLNGDAEVLIFNGLLNLLILHFGAGFDSGPTYEIGSITP